MSDYRFGVDDYGLNYYPHDGVYDEQEGIDWSKVERVEIDWVDFVRERTCQNADDHKTVWFICSVCGYSQKLSHTRSYCPNCGAKVTG